MDEVKYVIDQIKNNNKVITKKGINLLTQKFEKSEDCKKIQEIIKNKQKKNKIKSNYLTKDFENEIDINNIDSLKKRIGK